MCFLCGVQGKDLLALKEMVLVVCKHLELVLWTGSLQALTNLALLQCQLFSELS